MSYGIPVEGFYDGTALMEDCFLLHWFAERYAEHYRDEWIGYGWVRAFTVLAIEHQA